MVARRTRESCPSSVEHSCDVPGLARAGASTVELAIAFNSSVEAIDQSGNLGASAQITTSTVFSAVFVYAKFERVILVPPHGLPSTAVQALPISTQDVPVPATPLLFLGGALAASHIWLRRGRSRSAAA